MTQPRQGPASAAGRVLVNMIVRLLADRFEFENGRAEGALQAPASA